MSIGYKEMTVRPVVGRVLFGSWECAHKVFALLMLRLLNYKSVSSYLYLRTKII